MPISSHPDPHRRTERAYLTFVLGVSFGLLGAGVIRQLLPSARDRDARFMGEVRDLAAETFVEEIDPERLVDAALRGMIDGLDDYSHYYGPEEVQALRRETDGEFRGIGVVFTRPTTEGRILFPYPEAPAAEAGARVGDTILAIDGVRLADLAPGELQERIQLSSEGPIELLVRGLDGEERVLKVRPKPVVDPTVRHARLLDEEAGVGYVAVLSFSKRTLSEFDAAMEQLEPDRLRTLILDLRGNPGGILDSAVGIADRFLDEGPIVSVRGRAGTEVTEASAVETRYRDVELILLVDGRSASASEVLAGALQDHSRAVLVGEATYGKGTVQTLTPFTRDRAIIKLTTARYFTPSGRSIERTSEDVHGIEPDVHVPLEEAVRAEVHAFLRSYSPPPSLVDEIRAWEATREEPLIAEMAQDPQLAAALALSHGVSPTAGVASN